MAEQALKQEAKVERPQVRKVRFQAGVFLGQEVHELDLEGRWAQANKARVEVHPGKGVVVRHTKAVGGKSEDGAVWVPEGMIKQVDVSPEWRP